MSTSEDIGGDDGGRQTLIAEYVLGLHDTRTHARLERAIEADPALRAERDFWISRLGALNDGFAEASVPGYILPAIEARLFGAARQGAGWWNSLMVWRGIAAGALAVAVAVVGFNMMQPQTGLPPAPIQLVATLAAQEGSEVTFLALYDEAHSQVRITSLTGEAALGGDFELWYINGDQAPVSMGVVPVEQRLEIPLDAQTRDAIGPGTVLAVTLEQTGGSPTGAPQGPVVAAGAAMAI